MTIITDYGKKYPSLVTVSRLGELKVCAESLQLLALGTLTLRVCSFWSSMYGEYLGESSFLATWASHGGPYFLGQYYLAGNSDLCPVNF